MTLQSNKEQRGKDFTFIKSERDPGPQTTQHLYYKCISFRMGHTLHPGSYCGPRMPSLEGERQLVCVCVCVCMCVCVSNNCIVPK